MKNVKIISLALGLSVSLSLVNAFDISNVGKAIDATKTFTNNTSDILSGKRQKEEEEKKKAQAEADEKRYQTQVKFTEMCKKAYHKNKVAFNSDNRTKELQLFFNKFENWDTIVRKVDNGKYDLKNCYLWLMGHPASVTEEFKKETAKYAD